MKKILLGLFGLFTIFLIGCQGVDLSQVSDQDLQRLSDTAIKCNEPYIRIGTTCCLDKDNNGVCDNDQQPRCRQEPYTDTEEYQEEEPYTDYETYTVQVPYQEQECNSVQVPYQATELKEETLFDFDNEIIEPSGRSGSDNIELEQGTVVEVSFTADGQLNLWIMPSTELQRVLNDVNYHSNQYLLKRVDITSATASVTIPVTDNYAIYLKNENILRSKQAFSFKAVAKKNEQVTKTRAQQQCNMVTKQRNEERSRPVSKMKTLTKTRDVTKYREVCG